MSFPEISILFCKKCRHYRGSLRLGLLSRRLKYHAKKAKEIKKIKTRRAVGVLEKLWHAFTGLVKSLIGAKKTVTVRRLVGHGRNSRG